jgi:hypothetical protein
MAEDSSSLKGFGMTEKRLSSRGTEGGVAISFFHEHPKIALSLHSLPTAGRLAMTIVTQPPSRGMIKYLITIL